MTLLALAWLAGSTAVAVGLGELLVKVNGMGTFPVRADATIHHG